MKSYLGLDDYSYGVLKLKITEAHLDGLTEGEKIGKEKQWIATEKAQKKISSKIKELEKENERLKGIDAIEINGLRFNSPFEMIKWISKAQFEIKELKAQIEKMKCCGNCRKELVCIKAEEMNICEEWEFEK